MPDVDWFLCGDLMCDDTTVIVSSVLYNFASILLQAVDVKVKHIYQDRYVHEYMMRDLSKYWSFAFDKYFLPPSVVCTG